MQVSNDTEQPIDLDEQFTEIINNGDGGTMKFTYSIRSLLHFLHADRGWSEEQFNRLTDDDLREIWLRVRKKDR